MLRKLVGMISLVVLVGVLSTVSYANPIPTQITFGPSTTGSISVNSANASFTGVSGWAYQGPASGSFTLSDAVIAITGSLGNGVYSLASNAETFTVAIGPDSLSGTLSLATVTGPTSPVPLFVGTITVNNATSGFGQTGFPVGAVVDADFVAFGGHVSAGQVVPDPVPEPGTIAMMGSGLLAVAGFLRRKI